MEGKLPMPAGNCRSWPDALLSSLRESLRGNLPLEGQEPLSIDRRSLSVTAVTVTCTTVTQNGYCMCLVTNELTKKGLHPHMLGCIILSSRWPSCGLSVVCVDSEILPVRNRPSPQPLGIMKGKKAAKSGLCH